MPRGGAKKTLKKILKKTKRRQRCAWLNYSNKNLNAFNLLSIRPFLTGRILQGIVERVVWKIFLGNICPVHDLKISERLLRSKIFSKSDSWFYVQRISLCVRRGWGGVGRRGWKIK